MTLLRTAIGRFIRSAGNAVMISARVAGCISAPNTPCSTRKQITAPTSVDSPMAAEARVNPSVPARNTCRWPKRSPTRPATMSSTATASR